jgi:hypothetical protein
MAGRVRRPWLLIPCVGNGVISEFGRSARSRSSTTGKPAGGTRESRRQNRDAAGIRRSFSHTPLQRRPYRQAMERRFDHQHLTAGAGGFRSRLRVLAEVVQGESEPAICPAMEYQAAARDQLARRRLDRPGPSGQPACASTEGGSTSNRSAPDRRRCGVSRRRPADVHQSSRSGGRCSGDGTPFSP